VTPDELNRAEIGRSAASSTSPVANTVAGTDRRSRLSWARRNWWLALCVPLCLLTWTAFVYVGIRARQRTWLVCGVLYGVLAAVALACIAYGGNKPHSISAAVGGYLMLGVWIGGLTHAIAIRSRYEARRADLSDLSLEAAERRLSAQRLARRIVRERPDEARQLGIGRPDLRDAFDAGLVDINSAPPDAISQVCDIETQVATQIVEARRRLQGSFSSLEDMDLVLDLPEPVLVKLRDKAVAVPR
jgi:Helix-hairpin-helix motif